MKEDLVDYEPATGRMLSPPRQLFLELTSRCNLACVHCPVDYGGEPGRELGDLPYAAIEKLGPWIDAALAVNLNIIGEPLLYPRLPEVLARIGAGGARAHFNSNGLLLSRSVCEMLVEQHVASIVVSCDGLASNQAIRGIPYETVRARLSTLLATRAAARSDWPKVGVAITLFRRNREELPRLLDELFELGIDGAHVQPLIVLWEGLRDENPYLASDLEEIAERCREVASRHGKPLTLFRSALQHDERHEAPDAARPQLGPISARFGCIDPFYEIKIQSTGEVMACSWGLMGGLNLNRLALDEIWNHEWYRALRRRLHARRFEGRCANCPYVFGGFENQVAVRPGAHHSQEARLQARGASATGGTTS